MIIVIAAVALIAWILTHQSQGKGGPGETGGPPGGGRGGRGGFGGMGGGLTSVNVAKASTGDVPVYLNALGTVTPPATVTVHTQLSGQLFSVAFREGQTVSKGQLLAQIDPRPYQAALAQAEGALARDQALLANARLDLKRYQTLLAEDSIARQTAETQAATVRQYEGTVVADQGAVQSARVNLGYTRITAPVSGRLGLRQVDPGNYVTPSDTNGLVTITQVTPIDAVFTLPEDNLAQVTARMRTGARLPATAFDRTQQTALEDGYLLTLDNQIDTTTGTVKAKARFANDRGQLFPNQFVNVRLLVDTLRDAVIVPTSAILRGDKGLFVYVVDADRTVHVRYVQTGPVAGENTAVTSGLQPGETVVTDGSDRLRDGGRVLLPGDCPPAGMGGGAGAGGQGGHGGRHRGAGQGAAQGAAQGGGQHAGQTGGQRCTPVPMGGGAAGGGRMQAMLAQLDLDPGQQAKVKTITAAEGPKMRAAFQSGDMATAMNLRQDMMKQIEAVLRPDQKAKLAELQKQQASAGGGQGAGPPAPVTQAAPPVSAAPSGAPGPADRSRHGAPISDVPAAAAPTPAAGAHGRLQGPAPAMNADGGREAAAPPAGGPAGPGGPGGGRMQAMFAQLNLDPAQKAKVQAITAAQGPKVRAAYQSGDLDAARAAREDMTRQIDAVLRPDQRAKLAALRAQMRQGGPGGGAGPGPNGGA